jgi:hypothetical protein
VFRFYNAHAHSGIQVSYLTRAFGSPNPVVEQLPDHLLREIVCLQTPADLLPDSGEVATAFAAATSCPGLAGADGDSVLYIPYTGAIDEYIGVDSISVSSGTKKWVSTLDLGTEILACTPGE